MKNKTKKLNIYKKTIYYAKDKKGNTYGLDMPFVEELVMLNVSGEIEIKETQIMYADGTPSRDISIDQTFHPETDIFKLINGGYDIGD